jgi:hypothetical protein
MTAATCQHAGPKDADGDGRWFGDIPINVYVAGKEI